MNQPRRLLAACLAIFAVNAIICWPLFGVEYLDVFQTNEGYFITLGKQLRESWAHWAWSPTFNGGMPLENAYLPLVPMLVALGSSVTSPAHALHFATALIYSLGPVFLFLFAHRLSGRFVASLAAGLLWSLTSPALLIPTLLADMGPLIGPRRLYNIIQWGETPHNIALALLPLALYLIQRFLEKQTPRRFALAACASAAILISNAFSLFLLPVSVALLIVAQPCFRLRLTVTASLVVLSGYLLVIRLFPPSLIQLIRTNSPTVGGDYRLRLTTALLAASLVLLLLALWAATRSRTPAWNPALRFALLFATVFVSIAVLAYGFGIGFVPQPTRLHIEMELGVCLVLAFGFDALAGFVPSRWCVSLACAGVLAAATLTWTNAHAAHTWIKAVPDIRQTSSYQQAEWVKANLPNRRIFMGGEEQWWVNIFTGTPQLAAGFEATAPNWMQRVAAYTVFAGTNAGDQDGPISVFWLKAFGCAAAEVPGPDSKDHYHNVANLKKFDGLLPLLWSKDGNSIYQVPLRSISLAHVIPQSAIVRRQPIHGLDIDPVRPYVAALDDPAIPAATLAWNNPEEGKIHATIAAKQVVSVQVTYDVGWKATSSGVEQPIRSDALGQMIIEPTCAGECSIDLAFTGGRERRICSVVSVGAGLILLIMAVFDRAPKYPRMID